MSVPVDDAGVSPASAAAQGGPRVLIVDDELEMALLIAEELGDRGFRTVALASGRAAAERLGRETFDAVITDLLMPELDGLELLRASRELDPTRPVIIMTGRGALRTALEATRQGAYHYITKPFTLATLVHLLEAALGEAVSTRMSMEDAATIVTKA